MTRGDGLVLHLERRFSAPRAAVYRALTDPQELGNWWGPQGFTSPSVRFVPQIGGDFRIAMQPPNGDLFYLSGEFREVEPTARLAYTFRWDPPHPDDRDTVVTLFLEDRGDETEIHLSHGEFATQERYVLHEAGWGESFERLEELLS